MVKKTQTQKNSELNFSQKSSKFRLFFLKYQKIIFVQRKTHLKFSGSIDSAGRYCRPFSLSIQKFGKWHSYVIRQGTKTSFIVYRHLEVQFNSCGQYWFYQSVSAAGVDLALQVQISLTCKTHNQAFKSKTKSASFSHVFYRQSSNSALAFQIIFKKNWKLYTHSTTNCYVAASNVGLTWIWLLTEC